MKGYVTNIERDTLANADYRRVLFTGRNTQLELMTLQPGEEIGLEKHAEHDTLYSPPEHPDGTVHHRKRDDTGH